ncbi:MAG: DUF7483 domain-containing protein, partial [Candidatus Limnocylindrus sp.]
GDQSTPGVGGGYCNFGQRPFAYTAPSGFKALCTTNLPEPTIADGSTAMDVKLWSGDATAKSITGLGFSPDMVWYKERSSTSSHAIVDAVRGQTNAARVIYPDRTDAEVTANSTQSVTSLDSNGFTIGTDSSINESGQTYVAWTWDGGSSTVTNNDGSISSQVRANASAGFSIVTWTMQASGSSTIGHGLGVAPKFWLVKNRTGGTSNWGVYHSAVMDNNKFMNLNDTAGLSTYSNIWGTAVPTSTVFGINTAALPASSDCVGYFWAPVEGYSSMGSYVGNGSSNGVFVYTGHQIKFLLIKNTTLGGSNWRIIDTARNPYNVANLLLNPNSSNAEQTTTLNTIDLLSNGFKCRGTDGDTNSSGDTFIYCAFASHPFQTARAR